MDVIGKVDVIPWQVVALSGLIGFLVLVRYVHLRMEGGIG